VEPNDPISQGLGERCIVVGTDGSACATRAVEFAAHEAARWGALLHVVTAYYELPAEGGFIAPLGLFQGSAEAVVSGALHCAEELEPSVVLKGEAVLGTPGPVLATVSDGAAALVVGTRGHNELTGLLLGSVSEYVLHHASCPIIVIR
jgi:nucleotide-binding universal stress UspA family protein